MKNKILCILLMIILLFSISIVFAAQNTTLELSDYKAKAGESIKISGITAFDEIISIKVLDENNNIVYFNTVLSNDIGEYEDTFIVPNINKGSLTIITGSGTNIGSAELEIYKKSNRRDSEPETTKNDDGSVVIKNTEVEIDKQKKEAKVQVTSNTIQSAFDKANPNEEGKRKVYIDIPETDKIESYNVELPRKILENKDSDEIEINTNIGTVTLPRNMLSDKDYDSEDNIIISFKKVDKKDFDAYENIDEALKEKIGSRPLIQISLIEDGKVKHWENKDSPVKIAVPYTKVNDENDEFIVVWYIDGQGNVIEVPNGRYNEETGMVEFDVYHFSLYAIVYDYKTFNDLNNHLWAKHQIEVMASKGIIKGTGNDKFSPVNNIKRADFLTLLIRTLELNAVFDNNFDDINESDYYYEPVGIAKDLGITNGIGDNKFNPKANITREDMIVMTHKALTIKGVVLDDTSDDILDAFNDESQISSYAIDSVSMLVQEGLINGSHNMINPKGNTTRAEAAVLIYRIYNINQ